MSSTPIRYNYHTVDEMKIAAAECLPPLVYQYVSAGVADGCTLDKNESIFNKYALIPRRLQGITNPNCEVSIFGNTYALPFGAAPVGMQQLFHPNGELATTLACKNNKAPCILSTVSNISYKIASESTTTKPWFQLYPTDNLLITRQLIENAEMAGAEIIVLTVDVPVLGKRIHNARSILNHADYQHLRFGNLDPMLSREDSIHNPGLDWDLLNLIKEMTKCKIVVKGILHPEDAKLCMEKGVDGIIVSNHGGRQLNSNYSTLEALQKIKTVVPNEYPLFMDGGIRSAEDILKALMLGAKMVFLGRPICYGLAVGGQSGVDHLLNMLKTDLLRNMQLMGMRDLASFDQSQILRL